MNWSRSGLVSRKGDWSSWPNAYSATIAVSKVGAVGGIPTQQGIEPTYTFTVQGTDFSGQQATQSFSITINR